MIVGRWSGTIGPNRVADFVGDYSTFLWEIIYICNFGSFFRE